MKKRQKWIAICFCIGAVLFAATAFADIVSRTGYDQFKDAIKNTVTNTAVNFDSYTVESGITITDNGKMLATITSFSKDDLANGIGEDIEISKFGNEEAISSYNYSDPETHIYYDSFNDTYYISTYDYPVILRRRVEDPLKDDHFKDIEKIIDAAVGNLREHVMVDENQDGSREFYGNLNESQIPALVNAVTSFLVKQEINSFGYGKKNDLMPRLVDDVFIKKVEGKADANAEGIIEKLFATFVLSGRDEDGNVHDITFEIAAQITNINSTVITKPDLTGKKVVETSVNNRAEEKIGQKYVGTWKNDIVLEKDDTFIKIGERKLVITSIDEDYVYGTYTEVYNEGYEQYKDENDSFTFMAEIKDSYTAVMMDKDGNSDKSLGYMHFELGKIMMNMNEYRIYHGLEYDPYFTRVFEN